MRLSSSQLKIIAMISMLIDHVGGSLFPQFIILRIIGRIAFIIFAFELVEGFYHTSNFYKYFLRMLLFGLITEPFFDFAIFNTWYYPQYNNVMFEFVLALMMMYGFEYNRKFSKGINVIANLIVFAGMIFLSNLLVTDYYGYGMLIVASFYFTYNLPKRFYYQLILMFIINYYLMGAYQINIFNVYIPVQGFAVLAMIFIYFYSGEHGKLNKYVGYLFYPLHLFLIGIIRVLFF